MGKEGELQFQLICSFSCFTHVKREHCEIPKAKPAHVLRCSPPAAPAHLELGARLRMNSRLSAPGPGSPAAAQTCSLMHTRGCFGQIHLKLCFLRNDWARSLCAKQVLAGFSGCSSLTVAQMG